MDDFEDEMTWAYHASEKLKEMTVPERVLVISGPGYDASLLRQMMAAKLPGFVVMQADEYERKERAGTADTFKAMQERHLPAWRQPVPPVALTPTQLERKAWNDAVDARKKKRK